MAIIRIRSKLNVSMQAYYLPKFYRSLSFNIILFIICGILFSLYVHAEKQIDHMNRLRHESFLLANELRQSSNDLSSMVRAYVVTGDPIYQQHYQEILDIRNGAKPRPINYQNIYWDLVLKDDNRPRGTESAIALLELFQRAGFTADELAKLSEAKRNSDTLTQTEFRAMSLVDAANHNDQDRELAVRLLFDDAYSQAKKDIMRPISEFYALVDQRTLAAVEHSEQVAMLFRYIVVASALLWALMLYRSYQNLLRILGAPVKRIYSDIQRLGQGDFSHPTETEHPQAGSVLAWLRETRHNLAQIDQERRLSVANNQRLTRFYAILSQCNQAIVRSLDQQQLFDNVCRIVVEHGGLKMAWIGLIEPGSGQVKPVAWFGSGIEYLDGITISTDPNLPSGLGPTGTALREDRPICSQDFQLDAITAPWHARAENFGWRSSICLPLHRQGRVIGGFTLYAEVVHAFNAEEQNLLLEMTSDIDFALANFAHEQLRQANERALTESHTLLRSIIDTVPVRIFWKDRGLRYLGCNTLFARDAGLTTEQDLIGKDDFQLCWHEQAEHYQANDRMVIASGESSIDCEEPQTTPQGQQIWLKTSKVPLLDAEQHIIGLIGVYEDISERKKTEEHLRLSACVFDHSNEGILVTDHNRNIVDTNAAFSRISGYSREEVLGKNPSMLGCEYQDNQFYEQMWQSIHHSGHWMGEIWNQRKSGEKYAEWLSINSVKNQHGIVEYYVGISSDITAIKRHQEQLQYLAHYDQLTHLPNRVLVADRLQQAIVHASRSKHKVALIYIDLDGFKQINDTYGHGFGDQVLIKIAGQMQAALRDGDTLARLGGDEFIVILPELDSIALCQAVIERLLEASGKIIEVDGIQVRLSASIGASCYPQSSEISPDHLIRQADQAMYQAKLAGRNQYCLFDANQARQLQEQQKKIERIQQALLNQEFVLYYQPKVDLFTNRVIGVEGLIRWRHPQAGMIGPSQFLPLLDKHRLQIELGNWVLHCALDQLESWRQHGIDLTISINIDGTHLQHGEFLHDLRQALAAHPMVDPNDLELEILESSALEDVAGVATIMTACKALGVGFALDDFGTGYSSLTYLKRLPVKTIKIDQSFVKDMLDDKDDLSILQGVIGLAKAFERHCIAEGIETNEHAAMLREIGCRFGQGYAFAKPMTNEELLRWLQRLGQLPIP